MNIHKGYTRLAQGYKFVIINVRSLKVKVKVLIPTNYQKNYKRIQIKLTLHQ